jgi:hypothetical protein
MKRSPAEIAFRLRQEMGNLWLLFREPSPPLVEATPLAGLPDPESVAKSLRGTPYAAEIESLAGRILAHEFPLLGFEIRTGPEIRWRRDYVSGIESGTDFFRLIPYLDAARVGDHKVIWELNRHQHLVVLAQASVLTGRAEYLDEIRRQLESWFRENPFQRGVNWASALEVAFRALSWIWVYHLVGARLEASARARLLTGLYQHARHLELNLSVYFSPNTHLMGEAVALHALGTLFPSFPGADRRRDAGARMVAETMDRQVRADGTHFEQSTYYHVYSIDFFLFHAVLGGTAAGYRAQLERMAEYLHALLGPEGDMPLIGDDDGGRFFHPYGPRARFGQATLASCAVFFEREDWPCPAGALAEQAAWWFGPSALRPAAGRNARESRLFPDLGLAAMLSDGVRIYADAGPFGRGRGSHSHSDTLSLAVYLESEEILIDPATYTYVGDAAWRNWFRGSAAHNTVRIDGKDQAAPAGPFGWTSSPRVEIHQWTTGPDRDYLDASCRYDGYRHRRRFILLKKERLLFILDELDGGPGRHVVEQFWHTGEPVAALDENCWRIGERTVLAVGESGNAASLGRGQEHGWRSLALGNKVEAPVVTVRRECEFPAFLIAALAFGDDAPARVTMHSKGDEIECVWRGTTTAGIRLGG